MTSALIIFWWFVNAKYVVEGNLSGVVRSDEIRMGVTVYHLPLLLQEKVI